MALEELLARTPHFRVDTSVGDYAPGSFVRRLQSLPFEADAR